MKPHASEEEVEAVAERIRSQGLTPHPLPGATRTAIGMTGNTWAGRAGAVRVLPGVNESIRVTKPFKLASREMQTDETVVRAAPPLDGPNLPVIAGPCSVERRSRSWIGRAAQGGGGHGLRGGAFKPRTSPYSSRD